MKTSKLKKFAQYARRTLIEQVSSKLKLVLKLESAARRENDKAVADLEKQIRQSSDEQMVEKIAYVWFNRFCALRFMDVNRFNPVGVLSPIPGQFQPEILAEAKMGVMDETMIPRDVQEKVTGLLNGAVPSANPQNEAFRLLIVAVCNYYSQIMPFLFQKIADYTELLMPDDLLSGNSILAYTREALTPEACENVEVIGWLYQFYNSEKKDQVFDGLRKNKKITPENIPAATQLFTPHWIVRYLVENSLGRLWMLNRPDSRLIDRMEYYIRPDASEKGGDEHFIKISTPEEIKICDRACGSGHILTYAFDLLYAIYEEEGYDASRIPGLILQNNLYGIEIDERAGELAAFALFMKAREKYRRFFKKPVQPNICVLRNIEFPENDLAAYMDAIGRDLFTVNLQTLLHQFREADNFGSLIRPAVTNVRDILKILKSRGVGDNMFLANTHEKVLTALKQADYLSPRYHVQVTNPPYMGGKGMNGRLKVFAQENYPDSKSDLFAMFMERNLDMTVKAGLVAMITMQSWMFLSSFEKLREKILRNNTILSMAHLGERAFDTIGGAVVSTTAFVIGNFKQPEFKGGYLRLIDGGNEREKYEMLRGNLPVGGSPRPGGFYEASASDFKKIPRSPIAYWIKGTDLFEQKILGDEFVSGGRNKTHNNEKYLRYFWEVRKDSPYWAGYLNGGAFRKYAGNELEVVNWSKSAQEVYDLHGGLCNPKFWDKEGITWSLVTSAINSFRIKRVHLYYSSGSPTIFNQSFECDKKALALLNTPISQYYLKAINPTLNTTVSDVLSLPFIDERIPQSVEERIDSCIILSEADWDSYETSHKFSSLPIFSPENRQPTLAAAYSSLRNQWRQATLEMQGLEEENNSIFIEAYGLQDELSPDVPLEEITLACNPHYRYATGKTEEEYEKLFLADTMKEFLSYAVGCMFGRYSLDKPGLILANQGESMEDYLEQVPNPSFEPDRDNVIPILDQDWFMDDMAGRFHRFLRITFGETHYEENLAFIEKGIGKDIRKYFLKDFYGDHLKRYKKRPIYWLFSSPKDSFNALIYMHRYRPDTVSVVLNDYLREFRTKLMARREHLEQISISASASSAEKTRALKEIEKLKKTIDELDNYERDTLYPLAAQKVEIDLDDGVKVNYKKFGKALKKVPGLSS
ncbi:MAG: BREX-1 system adenine-specific DNA-methyltransferase PglX [Deltaproteobacteria bacterium]|nr:BREX-1 system adenine-specific DNA-methyltransferase PglX [Deltaproteobacteria bacterium]MBL7216976.1 BREX-1 system adenine-specific DNA-methyltransferase PglX [Desulfobacteraceae bacterium]